MMPLTKLQDFTQKIEDLPDRPNDTMTASELKQYFDGSAEEVRVALNAVIDVLQSTEAGDSGANNVKTTAITDLTGDNVQAILQSQRDVLRSTTADSSGADFIKSSGVDGLNGNTVQALLTELKNITDTLGEGISNRFTKQELQSVDNDASGASLIGNTPIVAGAPNNVLGTLIWLYQQIINAIVGDVPDGSITPIKLSFDPATQQELDNAVVLLQQQIDDIELTASKVSVTDTEQLFDSDNVEGALKEVMEKANAAFTSANNGKSTSGSLATTIIGKGGTLVDGDGDGVYTFQELTDGVGTIPAHIRFIQAFPTTIYRRSLVVESEIWVLERRAASPYTISINKYNFNGTLLESRIIIDNYNTLYSVLEIKEVQREYFVIAVRRVSPSTYALLKIDYNGNVLETSGITESRITTENCVVTGEHVIIFDGTNINFYLFTGTLRGTYADVFTNAQYSVVFGNFLYIKATSTERTVDIENMITLGISSLYSLLDSVSGLVR